MDNCKELNIPVHQTQRYSIENYFPLAVLRDVFVNQIDESIAEIDPKKKLEDQIGINVKNNNRKIAQKMTIQDIEATDVGEFFTSIAEMLISKPKEKE